MTISTNTSDICYENHIVAFVDILGFKEIIKQSERSLKKMQLIFQTLEFLKKRESPNKWTLQLIEIEDDFQNRPINNFDIKHLLACTSFSDSIVVSVKCNELNTNEIVSTLIANLSYIGAKLMTEGILLRGGITIGKLIHQNNGILMGQALIDAYQLESNSAKFPRILISNKLIDQLNYPIDSKKQRFPYHQYLDRFDDGFVGFHQMIYFQVLQNSNILDKKILKRELNKIRKTIINGLDSSFEHADTHLKYHWLKSEYEKLIITKIEKKKIYNLNEGLRGHNIHFSYTNNYFDKRK
jgi:hypothetical protein